MKGGVASSTHGKETKTAMGNRFGLGPECRPCVWAALLLHVLCVASLAVEPDRIFMRDGRTLTGNIVGETAEAYRTLIDDYPTPRLTNVAAKTVRYVAYGSTAKARTALRLDETARALGANDLAKIRFLPTESFGEAIAEAAASARERIWIMAYYVSGGSHETIQRFYNTVRSKAKAGMDVCVISEFGKGTPMPIRNATMNFAHTLLADGVAVRFVQEYRVMHKKVVLIDNDKVLLGSANLTGVGLSFSDEFSALIVSAPFANGVEADFKRLNQKAQPIE